MPIQLKVSGDPRRPAEAKTYQRRKPQDSPPDFFLLLALALGMAALLVKMKIFGWASVFCCLVAVANVQSGTTDFKQFVSSVVFAVFGLVSSYLQPPNKPPGRS